MKKRLITLLTALALVLSLLGVSALAADRSDPEQTQSGTGQTAEDGQEEKAGEEALGQEDAQAGLSQDAQGQEDEQEQEGEQEDAQEYVPDPVGTITFENLERRLRENNLTLLTLEENIQAIEVIDYDQMYETLRQNLNSIASAQWMMILYGMGETPEAKALEQSYDALRETFDAIKEGELQEDNEDALWQLRSARTR